MVDHGSFRSAAKALNLSPSVVSHHVAQLEEQLGTALLYRSTRKLSLTSDGERLLASAHDMIAAAETGLQTITNQSNQPTGELRITAPAVMAQSRLIDQIAAFTNAFPKVHLAIDFSDQRREVISEGIDVAVRMGWLSDSTLKARKLYDVERKLVATPSYLAQHIKPQRPIDIESWDWLELPPAPRKPKFHNTAQETELLKPDYRISVNDAHALYRLALAGTGLAVLPEFLVQSDFLNGELQHVLPDWTVEPVGVYAVWPPNAPKEGLTKRFIEFLARTTARSTNEQPVS
jgi:DNA-binding transcriptional LysR family regulator